MGTPRIAAITLQYGQWRKTKEAVTSLLHSTLPPYRIIVVDNASPDDSAPRIRSWLEAQASLAAVNSGAPPASERLIFLQMDANGGYAAGNNAGMLQAPGADAYLILNNDAVLAPDALENMWKALQSNPSPGLCGPTIAYPSNGAIGLDPITPADTGNLLVQCCAGGRTSYATGLSSFAGEGLTVLEAMAQDKQETERGLNFICGACVLASGRFVREAGPMDEGFFLYCEEQDWALRAGGRFSLTWAPEALCIHQEGASTGWSRAAFNWRSGIRLMRSRLRLARIHHPWYLPTVALGCVFAAGRLLFRKLTAPCRR